MRNKTKCKTVMVRKMTDEEKAELEHTINKEKERHETSKKIGGIDERGNYTALHHRYEG